MDYIDSLTFNTDLKLSSFCYLLKSFMCYYLNYLVSKRVKEEKDNVRVIVYRKYNNVSVLAYTVLLI